MNNVTGVVRLLKMEQDRLTKHHQIGPSSTVWPARKREPRRFGTIVMPYVAASRVLLPV
jgi:hypothetical protein